MRIINLQEIQNRNQLYISLFLMLVFTLALIVFKVFSTGNFLFAGIGFNLVLALVPFFLSSVVLFSSDKKFDNLLDYTTLFIWLITFPNAVYLITFFLHLNQNLSNWFDMLIVLSIAFNGLLLAFLSLFDIEKKLTEYFSSLFVKTIMLLAIVFGSIFIYIGKLLQWNGLDVINEPTKTFSNLFYTIAQNQNIEMFNFVSVVSFFLIFAYFLFRGVANIAVLKR